MNNNSCLMPSPHKPITKTATIHVINNKHRANLLLLQMVAKLEAQIASKEAAHVAYVTTGRQSYE